MKEEFKYSAGSPAEDRSVILDRDSHESVRRAVSAARATGLGIAIFSYSDILAKAAGEQDSIGICAIETGTAYDEQLKSMFTADAPLSGQSRPNVVIALLKYSDRIDFSKLADALQELGDYGKPVGTLKRMRTERFKIPYGYLGINPKSLLVPALFTPSKGENFKPYTDQLYSSWILDESLRDLTRFCMLVGYRKADALVAVGGQNQRLGNRLDIFFKNYFEKGQFAVADIKEIKHSEG